MGEPNKQLSLPAPPPGSRYPKYKGWEKSHTLAERFVPHKATPVVTVDFVIPKVFFSPQAMRDMFNIVDLVDGEVGWWGSVEAVDNDYLVKEVFLPRQEANHGTCEITASGTSSLIADLRTERPDDWMDIANSIRFWGHSHHNMATGPSGQDDQQLAEMAEACEDYAIRAIANKKGRIQITVYDYASSLIFKDVEWSVYDIDENSRREFWEAEITAKVKPIEAEVKQITRLGHYIDVGHGRKRWVPDDGKTHDSGLSDTDYWRQVWEQRQANNNVVDGEVVEEKTDKHVSLCIGTCCVCDKAIYDDDEFEEFIDGENHDYWHLKACFSTQQNGGGESVDGLLHPLE